MPLEARWSPTTTYNNGTRIPTDDIGRLRYNAVLLLRNCEGDISVRSAIGISNFDGLMYTFDVDLPIKHFNTTYHQAAVSVTAILPRRALTFPRSDIYYEPSDPGISEWVGEENRFSGVEDRVYILSEGVNAFIAVGPQQFVRDPDTNRIQYFRNVLQGIHFATRCLDKIGDITVSVDDFDIAGLRLGRTGDLLKSITFPQDRSVTLIYKAEGRTKVNVSFTADGEQYSTSFRVETIERLGCGTIDMIRMGSSETVTRRIAEPAFGSEGEYTFSLSSHQGAISPDPRIVESLANSNVTYTITDDNLLTVSTGPLHLLNKIGRFNVLDNVTGLDRDNCGFRVLADYDFHIENRAIRLNGNNTVSTQLEVYGSPEGNGRNAHRDYSSSGNLTVAGQQFGSYSLLDNTHQHDFSMVNIQIDNPALVSDGDLFDISATFSPIDSVSLTRIAKLLIVGDTNFNYLWVPDVTVEAGKSEVANLLSETIFESRLSFFFRSAGPSWLIVPTSRDRFDTPARDLNYLLFRPPANTNPGTYTYTVTKRGRQRSDGPIREITASGTITVT